MIQDIAYFGSHSVYHVKLPGGFKFMANFTNRHRWDSDSLTWYDEVWVSWGEEDGVVLSS